MTVAQYHKFPSERFRMTLFIADSQFRIKKTNKNKTHNKIHSSIHFRPLIQGRVTRAAAWAGTPRLPSPRTLPPALPGGSQGVPRPAGQHSHSSVSWVFLWVSSRRDMPGTPREGVTLRGLGRRGPRPWLTPKSHCTGPFWTFLRVVSPLEGGPTSLVRAAPASPNPKLWAIARLLAPTES